MIRTKTLDVAAGQRMQFVALDRDAGRLEVEDAFFNTGSAVFLPDVPAGSLSGGAQLVPFTNGEVLAALARSHERFTMTFVTVPFEPDASDTPARDTGLHVIIAALRFLERNPTHALVVAGHTDRAGDDAFNTRLSRARGKGVVALLEGKRSDFVAVCREFHAPEDDPVILGFAARTRGFACQPASPASASSDEVRGFQRSFNTAFKAAIAVDGTVGDETRGAYFDLYEDDLAASAGGKDALLRLRSHLRFVDPAHKVLALGERFPRENPAADGLRSQRNRRVELLFFAPPRLPTVSAPDAGMQIYRRKLFQFSALDRNALAAASVGAGDTDRQDEFSVTPVGGPEDIPATQPATTEMPNAGRRDPDDAWAFLVPFHQLHPFEGRDDPTSPSIVVGDAAPRLG